MEENMRTPLAFVIGLMLSTSVANAAMSEADCQAAFKKSDVNNDGIITETEGSQYFASMRVANKTVAEGKLSMADFITNCKTGLYDTSARINDAGAPLSGANSFTENQARDRALAVGLKSVSALIKDDSGIWRGTAMSGEKNVKLAVDFKGNVVAN
jgi:hypothetical protein